MHTYILQLNVRRYNRTSKQNSVTYFTLKRDTFATARHRKSDWKYNLVRCSVCKNLRQQHPLQPKYTCGKRSFGWVNIYALNLFVSGPKCTNFFSPNIRNQNQNLSNFIPNFAYFGPKISYGTAPKFLDLDYKVHPNIYHILKFHAKQPSKLEDPGEISKKLKKSQVKCKAFQNYRSTGRGRPNYTKFLQTMMVII